MTAPRKFYIALYDNGEGARIYDVVSADSMTMAQFVADVPSLGWEWQFIEALEMPCESTT